MKNRPNSGIAVAKCLADFLEKSTSGVSFVAQFTGVTDQTIRCWVKGSPVTGERYIRLLALMRFAGYEVKELSGLQPTLISLVEHIALQVMSLTEMAKVIGAGDSKRIFEYVRGDCRISDERAEKLAQAFEQQKDTLLAEKKKFMSRLVVVFSEAQSQSLEPDELIKQFAAALEVTRRLGRQLLNGDRNVRFNMRAQIGSGDEPLLHTTWETLNYLLSEREEIGNG